jgi:outer membrane lipopolysaccharide assembly protein LptE/RlpB
MGEILNRRDAGELAMTHRQKRPAEVGMAMLVLMVAATALWGCGYRFSGEGEGPKPGLRKLAIPVFENNTSEPDLGALFAGALRSEFMQKGDGDIRVVPTEEAEAIFHGRIKDIYTSAAAHHDARQTIESRLYVTLEVKCVDIRTGNTLWQDSDFRYYRVFLQNLDPMIAFENRREALNFLAREMAIRIHDRFLSNF